jgi:glucosamine kinase
MKLIADSGSTKTDWTVVPDNATADGRTASGSKASSGSKTSSDSKASSASDSSSQLTIATQGINPFHQSASVIDKIIEEELIPQLASAGAAVDDAASCGTADTTPSCEVGCNENFLRGAGCEIHFYGAGCTAEASPLLAECLHRHFGKATNVEVGSDMLGAARALCQHQEGIACILGTGANSCYYDGTVIRENVSPLGYILGDEGSGAYIGKRLVGDVLKRQFSPAVCDLFHDETGLDAATIINKVYRQPMPNRFLGNVARFCSNHRDNDEIHSFLVDCFRQFFQRNVANYRRPSLPVHFVGSVAWAYEAELSEAAETSGFHVGTVMRSPMEGLLKFHS